MTDSLCDRIATAIAGVDDWRGVDDPTILADAVIAALGLRQEWAVADFEDDHIYVGRTEEDADEYAVLPNDHKQTRYVTEWYGELTDSESAK